MTALDAQHTAPLARLLESDAGAPSRNGMTFLFPVLLDDQVPAEIGQFYMRGRSNLARLVGLRLESTFALHVGDDDNAKPLTHNPNAFPAPSLPFCFSSSS